MANPISREVRDFVSKHYLDRGAQFCSGNTGLTINQVWGLAYRLGLTDLKRKGQRHAKHRSFVAHSTTIDRHLRFGPMIEALQGFTATHQGLEQEGAT